MGEKLGLKVNATKTKITTPNNLRYLGFEFFFSNGTSKARPYKDSKERLAKEIKQLCKRNLSIDLDTRITKLNQVARSWVNYFKIGDMKKFLLELSAHIKTMPRIIIWKQGKFPGKRQRGL